MTRTSPESSWFHRHPVATFFALSILLSWSSYLVYFLAKQGTLPAIFQLVGFVAKFGPSLAGILAAAWLAGPEAVSGLFDRTLAWRLRTRDWIVCILGPMALLLAAQGLAGGLTEATIQLSAWWLFLPRVLQHIFLGGGLGEELGWRGFALPLLQRRYTALRASLIIGLVWAAWHLPETLLAPSREGAIRFAVFTVAVLALSPFFTWVYNSTGGSLFAVVLLHACFNASEWFLDGVLQTDTEPLAFDLAVAGLVVILALALVAFYGPRDLSRHGRVTEIASRPPA